MPERDRFRHHFGTTVNKAWGFHFGACFCVEPKDITDHRDVYLMLYLGVIDVCIGMITDYISDEELEGGDSNDNR